MTLRLIVHAPSVHEGGGRSLLVALLEALGKHSGSLKDAAVILDGRFDGIPDHAARIRVLARSNPGLLGRWAAERLLASTAQPEDVVLSLGNLPPLYRLKSFTLTYVQNSHIAEPDLRGIMPWTGRLRILLLRLCFRAWQNHSDCFLVQTESMRDRLVRWSGIDRERVVVSPFAERSAARVRPMDGQGAKEWDFCYVAMPWCHKNHIRLVEAFILLAQDGVRPSLALTISRETSGSLANLIEWAKEAHGVRIITLGRVPNERMGEIYTKAKAFIFPSLGETIGLPLLEAKSYGLPILAPELDYVRDVVVPSETFDPKSPLSIKRAVLRFLGRPDKPREVGPAEEFLEHVVQIKSRWACPSDRN